MQRAGLTKSEIEKMDRVDKAHRATGFQSMYKMLRSKLHNTIAGTPETGDFGEKDIRNYAKAMHPAWCRGCNASAIEEPAHSLDPITPAGISEAHGDGWFLTAKIEGGNKIVKQSYLLFVDNRTQNVLCFLLKADGNSKDFIAVFEELIGTYKAAGHTLTKIKLDNWRTGIEKSPAHKYLQQKGIEVTFSTPGRKVKKAETFIGYLKSHLKKIVFSLRPGIMLPLKFYEYAVRFAVQTLNLAPSEANKFLSPHALFTGQQVTWKKHARFR